MKLEAALRQLEVGRKFTPPALVVGHVGSGKLQMDLVWALAQPDVRERFDKLGTEPRTSSAEQLRTLMQKDVERAEDLVKRGVIKITK